MTTNKISITNEQGKTAEEVVAFVHSKLVEAFADFSGNVGGDNNGNGDGVGNDGLFCICLLDSRGRRFFVISPPLINLPQFGQMGFRNAHDVVFTPGTADEAVTRAERILNRLTRITGNVTAIMLNCVLAQETVWTTPFQWVVYNQVEFPRSEEAGYQELLAHFWGALPTDSYGISPMTQPWKGPKVDHERILAILTRYPNLASRKMKFGDYEVENGEEDLYGPGFCFYGCPPLCCILGSPNAASLDIVKAVYEMTPENILPGHEETLLSFSLLINPSNEVVEFIFKTGPNAIFDSEFNDGYTQMERVLPGLESGTIQLSTLRLLLNLCPEIAGFQTGHNYHDLLEMALDMDCPLEAVSLIATRYPWQRDSISIPGDKISRPKVQILRTLLPQFTELSLGAGSSNGALPMLLSSIARGPNALVELSLSSMPLNPITGQLIKLVLSRTSTLQELEVYFEENVDDGDTVNDMAKAFHKILAGLYVNTTIRRLELENFPSTQWDKTLIYNEDAVEQDQGAHVITTRALRYVSLRTHCLHESFVPGMLAAFPTVRKLALAMDLEENDPYDLGNLFSIQQTCINLEILDVRIIDDHIDEARLRKLCNVLKKNAPITCLNLKFDDDSSFQQKVQDGLVNVLQEFNVTLDRIEMENPTPYRSVTPVPKLQYFLDLNKCGRKVARDHRASKASFVQLLAEVFAAGRFSLESEEHKNNVQHGLLRVAPGLWSL